MHLAGSLSLHIQHTLRTTVKCTLVLINQCKTSVDNFHLLVEQLYFIWSQSDNSSPNFNKINDLYILNAGSMYRWMIACCHSVYKCITWYMSLRIYLFLWGSCVVFLELLNKMFSIFFPSLLGFTLINICFSFFTKNHFEAELL